MHCVESSYCSIKVQRAKQMRQALIELTLVLLVIYRGNSLGFSGTFYKKIVK